jgi:VWFA-related protein
MSCGLGRKLSLLLLLFGCLPAVSQQIRIVKIGVALPSSRRDQSAARDMRDDLVKQLNRHQLDRKRNLALQAVALEASPGAKAIVRGREKNCEFLVYLRVEAVEQSKVLKQDAAGATENNEIDTALVEYQLRRGSDGTTQAIGMVKSQRLPSRVEAILDAIAEIPNKVANDVANAGSSEPAMAGDGAAANNEIAALDWDEPLSPDSCSWLPNNIAHAHALEAVCRFAARRQEKMPNFMCQQSTARYRGSQRSPTDLITATVRYVDGEESYRDLKRNGRELPGVVWSGAGLWSSGQFEGDLRAIFYRGNRASFAFARADQIGSHAAWVFSYTIAWQNEPLWELRAQEQLAAPPYEGELWVDQKTGTVLRFSSTAKSLPAKFQIRNAEITTDYDDVAFPDGSSVVLPVKSEIRSRFEGQEPTRNVVEFRGCRMFRATSRMVVNAEAEGSRGAYSTEKTEAELQAELEENETIYNILRDEAIAEDAALTALEQFQSLKAATGAAYWKLAQLRRQEEKALDAEGRRAPTNGDYGIDVDANGTAKFKIVVKLVPVTVVVRDKKGNAVGSLTKADFELLDGKKAQEILSFSLEKNERKTTKSKDEENAEQVRPNNVAYVFDDLHATATDLMHARTAAEKHLRVLESGDRVALFTTSGEVTLEFTSDLDKLRTALAKLKSHTNATASDCPAMNYYIADLILNQGDQNAMQMAVEDTLECEFPDQGLGGPAPRGGPVADRGAGTQQKSALLKSQQTVLARAYEVASMGKMETDRSLSTLNDALTRITVMSGRRTIILLSPGFLTVTRQQQQGAMVLIQNALQADVVFSALDVEGLKGVNLAANRGHVNESVTSRTLEGQEGNQAGGVMADLAYGTGGVFWHGNNDLDEGLRRMSDPPRYVYVIGFSPQKLDGKFHKLKVTVKGSTKLNVQARPGYYALKSAPGS